jgi:hypothetical protein
MQNVRGGLAVVAVLTGCAGANPRTGNESGSSDAGVMSKKPLHDCIAAAYLRPDIDEAMERCEIEHVGRGWRAEWKADAGTMPGFLEPSLIQASVRSQFDHLRACYEHGLARDRNLRGRVAVRFAISSSGRVESASDEGSDLPDGEVITCVVHEFSKLRFPKPEGQLVTVVYPIIFNPR